MLVDVDIEETLVDRPSGSPTPGLCGICGHCELELTVEGETPQDRRRLLCKFDQRCPDKGRHRHQAAVLDERSPPT